MRKSIGLKLSAVVALVVVGVASSANAINFSGSYAENFDSIGPTGTAVPTGWQIGHFSPVVNVNGTGGDGLAIVSEALLTGVPEDGYTIIKNGLGGGGANGQAINYGHSSNSSDRAIGNVPRTNYGDHLIQVDFINTTGAPITEFSVTYTGEQWSNAQGTSGNGAEKIRFFYNPSAALSGFVAVSTLDFTALKNAPLADGPYLALNGNLAENRTTLTATITPASAIPVNGAFSLRWLDWNENATTDHGLAIDDFQLNATVSPEPASLALLGLGAVTLLKRRRH